MESPDIIERIQQSAHMTADHNAAHALHAAVVEIRRLEGRCATMQTLITALRDVNAAQDRERHRCGGMVDEMAIDRRCVDACAAVRANEREPNG